MSDRTVIDGSLFFRLRGRASDRPMQRPLYLDGIGVCELLYLLRHTDLAITTDSEGRNVLHHKPPTPEAA